MGPGSGNDGKLAAFINGSEMRVAEYLTKVGARVRPVSHLEGVVMNNIVWIVGAVVIILFVLGYFGLR